MKIRTPIKFGFVSGISGIIFQLLIYLISPKKVSTSIWMFIVYLPILFFMIFGGITYRRESNGGISFGQSFISVFVIAFSGILMLNIFTYEILMRIIDPNLFQTIVDHARETLSDAGERKGLSDEIIQEGMTGLDNLTPSYLRNVAWGVSGFFTIFLSLLITLFVKRPDRQIQPESHS